jgi:hypothetical protein
MSRAGALTESVLRIITLALETYLSEAKKAQYAMEKIPDINTSHIKQRNNFMLNAKSLISHLQI